MSADERGGALPVRSRTRHVMGEPRVRKPGWLTMAPRSGQDYIALRRLVRDHDLHTICAEARCPNQAECWNARTATFLILGDRCTRRCTFCNVGYGWSGRVDQDEPRRLAEAVATLSLRHAVITSVDRDDLPDGGASIFVQSVERIRAGCPGTRIELLVPDFAGKAGALERVMAAGPDVLAHNLETVQRLYPGVRPRSSYAHSLGILRRACATAAAGGALAAGAALDAERAPAAGGAPARMAIKTGLMVGLGEEPDELTALLADVREVGVDILTIGQYLQPSAAHHRVERFYTPDEFAELGRQGRALGIPHVESGPLVRSSYHAAQQAESLG